ncbi:chlorophyllase-2-like [Syzygium oleosum]|uniref:chlorophyllase-2-like n=1 Tax=Syzygium oleosum TaxID=219896 RepID=UPI0011D21222|nr:chlorophyllase-2-like [Syzygium oleosum]
MAASTMTTDVFQLGKYETVLIKVATSPSDLANPPPKPLLIGAPAEAAGEFPVMVLLHGFMMETSFYSQLIRHVSSHGFIVVAPQLYTCSGSNSADEINAAAATTNWLSQGLAAVLPPQVRSNLSKLVLAGHSRGGKDAFALALGKSSTPLALPFSALIGIDPVDGLASCCCHIQTKPAVLTYVAQSFDLKMPVMVIGSGLGEDKKCGVLPACAPKGLNHAEFFKECRSPAWRFLALDYGHMDMLDDDTPGLRGLISYCSCKNGRSREPMRRFVGGVAVAFMRAYLEDDDGHVTALKDTPDIAPVQITVEVRL